MMCLLFLETTTAVTTTAETTTSVETTTEGIFINSIFT